jgi:hypothetical protein
VSTIILDLDNCISDDGWRIRHIDWSQEGPADRYRKYHELSGFDSYENRDLYVNTKHDLVVLTARPDCYRAVTMEWLHRAGISPKALMMRIQGDHRPSSELKKNQVMTMMALGMTPGDVECAYDDRQDVVDMYFSLGIMAERRWIHDLCAYTNPINRRETR